MRLVKRIDLAKTAAERWKAQYCPKGRWREGVLVYGRTKEEIYNGLVTLGPNPDPNDVNATIGNSSWTSCRCDECGGNFEEVLLIGDEPDYDSRTVTVCVNCVMHAETYFNHGI